MGHRQLLKVESLDWRIISSRDTALTMDSTDLLVDSSTSGVTSGEGHHLLDLLALGVEDVGQSGLLQGHGLNEIGDGLVSGGGAGGNYRHTHSKLYSFFCCIEPLLQPFYAPGTRMVPPEQKSPAQGAVLPVPGRRMNRM